MNYGTVTENSTAQQVTDTFAGYDHNLKIPDGEFYDMENLCSTYYPMMANRPPRGIVAAVSKPNGLLAKEKLAYVDGEKLYYDGAKVEGITLTDGEKQLVSMGAYLLIWPDKKYVNTRDLTDCGSMENAKEIDCAATNVSYALCTVAGAAITATASASQPKSPASGQYWINTSTTPHTLLRYSASSYTWVQISTCYVKISATGIGASFKAYDGVSLSGITYSGTDTSIKAEYEALNGTKVIYAAGDDYIVVTGLLDKTDTQTTGTVKAGRSIPEMDYVCEAQNRIWGCKYGSVDGKNVNELYCSKLGDFKNWNCFLGISTDSWASSVGSDGAFTGAVNYNGYPTFFKENTIHRIAVSSTGAHQVTETKCRGVQDGSYKSLVVVNEVLYYKGTTDVCVYDGSYPESISTALGEERYTDASAGCVDGKYYISMCDNKGYWHMMVYDSAKGIWHREDNTYARFFAQMGEELYFLDAENGRLECVNGTEGTLEGTVKWSATTGIIGYSTVEQKYVSRLNLRMKLPKGAKADLYIQYDSSGIWESCGHMVGIGTSSFMLPVRPQRCDHFQFRLDGEGDIRLYSMAKILEVGSDEAW